MIVFFACDCCEREVVLNKKPGIGYYCDPCIKCFEPYGEAKLPEGVFCYNTEDLEWMRSQVQTTSYYVDRLLEEMKR